MIILPVNQHCVANKHSMSLPWRLSIRGYMLAASVFVLACRMILHPWAIDASCNMNPHTTFIFSCFHVPIYVCRSSGSFGSVCSKQCCVIVHDVVLAASTCTIKDGITLLQWPVPIKHCFSNQCWISKCCHTGVDSGSFTKIYLVAFFRKQLQSCWHASH